MSYRFIPWVKTGTGAGVSIADPLDDSPASRVGLPVTLRVNDRHDAPLNLRLFGPGDVVGIDPQQVIRVEPRALTPDFEPNYFPVVEFRRPDFPWVFTPVTGDSRGRLRPWLCLVVVRRQEGVRLGSDRNRPLPVLTISAPAEPSAELPDLADSWAWAHTQVVGQEQGAALAELLAGDSPRAISRLLAPVRLRPATRYYACLVPAFEAGRKAGLGLAPGAEDDRLAPAWRSGAGAPAAIELPVYFHWEFGTGAGGDFESLVRRLQGRPVPDGVGARGMRVEGLGFGLPDLGVMPFEGALRSPKAAGPPPDAAKLQQFQTALRGILNSTVTQGQDADPVVGPPIYGRYQGAAGQVPAPNAAPVWLRELNLDPRHRGAAGLGSLVVQDQQEQLMAAAWEQLGGVQDATRLMRQGTLGIEIGGSVLRRHMSALSEPRLLQVTAPAHARVRFGAQAQAMAAATSPTGTATSAAATAVAPTVDATLRSSHLSSSVTSPAFRRIFRAGGPVARRVEATVPATGPLPVTTRLVERMVAQPTSSLPMQIILGFATTAQTRAQMESLRASVLSGAATYPAAARLLAAGDQLQAYLATAMPTPPPLPAPPPLSVVKQSVMARLDPREAVTLRISARLSLPQTTAAAALSTTAQPASGEVVLPHPEFPQPMYEALRDISQDFLLPGAANVPADTVTAVKTNPQFVESFMVGLNHEMSRELLWREYPTDQRGTYFTRFWDVGGMAGGGRPPQIAPIHQWTPASALGKSFLGDGFEGRLVLLIRGEVLRRYPGTVVCAVRADTLGTPQAQEIYPLFRGALEPDMVFLGFDLTEAAARGGGGQPGYYFVLQEQPAEPRFGLDIPAQFGADPAGLTTWDDLTWGHVAADAAGFEQLNYLPLAGPVAGRRLENAEWGFNAAHMARILLQKRVRVAIHANELLPPKA